MDGLESLDGSRSVEGLELESLDGPRSVDGLRSLDGPGSVDRLVSLDVPGSVDGPASVDASGSTAHHIVDKTNYKLNLSFSAAELPESTFYLSLLDTWMLYLCS